MPEHVDLSGGVVTESWSWGSLFTCSRALVANNKRNSKVDKASAINVYHTIAKFEHD